MQTLEGWDWSRYRAYLKTRAELIRLNPKLKIRFDESDLVQETLLRAANPEASPFQGGSESEKLNWLDGILANTLIDLVRRHQAEKRDVSTEAPLEDILNQSTLNWNSPIKAPENTPDVQASINEQRLRLGEAIQRLPLEEREVVMSRDILGLTMTEIAQETGRSIATISRAYRRGIEALKVILNDGDATL